MKSPAVHSFWNHLRDDAHQDYITTTPPPPQNMASTTQHHALRDPYFVFHLFAFLNLKRTLLCLYLCSFFNPATKSITVIWLLSKWLAIIAGDLAIKTSWVTTMSWKGSTALCVRDRYGVLVHTDSRWVWLINSY